MRPDIAAQFPVWFLALLVIGCFTIVSGLFGFVVYLLKDLKRRFEEDLTREKSAREKLSESCDRCREMLPRTYVFRDDFIREIVVLGRKMELVFKEIKDMRKDLIGERGDDGS